MYFFAQLSNYSVRCSAEFPADICSISIKALYFQVLSDGRQYNFHLPKKPVTRAPLRNKHILPSSLSLSLSHRHTHTHHPLFATHPHAEITTIGMHLQPRPPRGQDHQVSGALSSGKRFAKARMVSDFRMTCYGSSRFDPGLHRPNVWIHTEKLLWRISSDV